MEPVKPTHRKKTGPDRKAGPQSRKPAKAVKPAYLRAKLGVSQPGDPEETQADQVAQEVSRAPRSVISRAIPEEVEENAAATSALRLYTGTAAKIGRQENPEEEEEPIQARLNRQEEQEEETLQARLYRQEEEEEFAQAKIQRQEEQEEETLQTRLYRQEEEEEAIQAKLRRQEDQEEEMLQTRLYRQEEEEEALQTHLSRNPEEDENPTVDEEIEQRIENRRGMGRPLPDDLLEEMEARFGRSFKRVRIHTDAEAAGLNAQLHARAFTVGNDILFGAGEYTPNTEAGRHLLAHELAHVVQQRSGMSRKIHRNTTGSGTNSTTDSGTLSNGYITFNTVKVPGEYESIYASQIPLYRHKTYNDNIRPSGNQDQRVKWSREILGQQGGMQNNKTALRQKLGDRYGSDGDTYVFRAPSAYQAATDANPRFIIGNLEQVANSANLPTWNKSNQPSQYQVDHIVELVVSNWPQRQRANSLSNYQLLTGEKNRAKKEIVMADVNQKVDAFRRNNDDQREKSLSQIKRQYHLKFEGVENGGGVAIGNNDQWLRTEIQAGDHLDAMIPAGFDDLGDENRQEVWLFPDASGGVKTTFQADGSFSADVGNRWIKPFIVDSASFRTSQTDTGNSEFGSITINVSPDDPNFYLEDGPETKPLTRFGSSRWSGYIDRNSLRRSLYKLRKKQTSPIEVGTFEITPNSGLMIRGQIRPSLPIIQDHPIFFEFSEGELTFSKTFYIEEINAPSPFRVNNSSLTLSAGTRGLAAEGEIDFGIDRVGQGNIAAAVSTQDGMSLSGDFSFDERIFGRGTDARVNVGYRRGEWSLGGTISIPRGRVPGVRSARINANYSESEGFSARGDAQLDVPGVESGTLEIAHSEETGFSIGGTFALSADTPGIRGGSVSARLEEKADGSGFAIRASGEAQPDIPGINSNLSVAYNDGAFTAEVSAQYRRGMLSGQINAGVTNRTVGEGGDLSETAEPDNPLIVYGGGELTVQIAPWLQGTAGVQFAPDGEITVSGEIGIPDELEIFPRREINRSIFNIAVQVPIVPGIVAEIGGGLGAVAGIGPGVIDRLNLGITYNPAHEENTTITGDAHLRVPADAGLRLSVRAGIGLGITGASATGGLEIGGTLGIEGAAEAGVHVDWTPATGLDLSAEVSVHAQPSFTFDISGYVSVRALGFSVYDERWQLAAVTFGSDYRFGIRLPVHYREGEPFDISLDDVEFEIPDIDTDRLLRGLVDRIT